MIYKGLLIVQRNGRFKIYHSDGQLLISAASKKEAIGWADFYSDPTQVW